MHAHHGPSPHRPRGVDGWMPPAVPSGRQRRTASDDSVNPRRIRAVSARCAIRAPPRLKREGRPPRRIVPPAHERRDALAAAGGGSPRTARPRRARRRTAFGPDRPGAVRSRARAPPVDAPAELPRREGDAREHAQARDDPARARCRCRAPRIALRARLAGRARRRGRRHPVGRGLPDRHPLLRRALRHPRRGPGPDPTPRQAAPPCRPHARAVDLGARPPPIARRRPLGPVASRRRHRAVRARTTQRGVAPRGRAERRDHRRLRRSTRAREAGRGSPRHRRPPRGTTRHRRRRPRSTGARTHAARLRISPDSSAATIWPPRWRASTCSCTPARARRSARRSRRRWRAAFPWSPRAPAAPSTWCARASTAGSTVRATSPSCAAACSTSRATTRSGGRSRCAPVRPSPAADGTVSATSSSSTTRRSPSGTARRAVSGSAGCAEAATPSHDRRRSNEQRMSRHPARSHRRAGGATSPSATRSPRGCATPRACPRGSTEVGPTGSPCCSRSRAPPPNRSATPTSPCAVAGSMMPSRPRCLGPSNSGPTS